MIVYESLNVTLHHADALDVLPSLAKESLDLVLTDPPYGDRYASNRRSERFGEIIHDGLGDREMISQALSECVRVVGQSRHLYVFGPRDVLHGLKVSEPIELIWDKGVIGMGDLSGVWGPQHEPISFAVSKFRHAGEAGKPNLATRMRKGSVLRYMRPTGRKVRHPNEKPIALLRELIESSTRAGDVVLDPFAGSGSTGVAAVLAGRSAILIEKDDAWIPMAIERLRQAEELADAGARV